LPLSATGARFDVRIADMNWMQVEEYLRRDDRAVLPLGSTEQHSHLRLTVDCILPERVAAEAAEPLASRSSPSCRTV
jgi:creatinine amidohydrolase